MNILVTGGAGFIGTHLVSNLLRNNFKVRIFEDFSNSKKESISHLIDLGVEIIEGDITNLTEILEASKDQEVIIHLAAIISVEESIRNPKRTFEVNVQGTKNILEACKQNNIKKLVVASSSAVYGESSENQKLTENSDLNPISPYGESKLRMEQEINNFVTKNKINVIILRFFNIFGIGQSSEYAGVITKFADRIRENKSPEIFGDGNQTRDFVSVNDVVNSIIISISIKNTGIYNIASGKVITIKDLANKMIELSGKTLNITFRPAKKGDIKFSQADITLAKTILKYSPKFELNEIKNLLD